MSAGFDEIFDKEQLSQIKRLKFDAQTEADFVDYQTASTLGRVRVVFAILVVFGLLGLIRPPNTSDQGARNLDFAFIAMYGVLFAMALSHRFRHLAAPGLATSAVLSQIAFGLTAKNLDIPLGILINLMYGIVIISALQVRFNVAFLFALAMLAARAWTFSYRSLWAGDAIIFFIFISIEFLFLVVGSYLSEVRDRKSFLFQKRLATERARTHELVQNVLPPTIANELSKNSGTLARHHDSATVMFADIVGFTRFAETHPPDEVVGMLNSVFLRFDALVQSASVLKLKTVGDAYMIVGGIPEPDPDHVLHVANIALELRGAANAAGIAMRIGLHTGPLIAGVLGTERLMYDVWGPTVNKASRLETSASAGVIAVSNEVRDALNDTHDFEGPFTLELKGLGETTVWHLTRRKIQAIGLS